MSDAVFNYSSAEILSRGMECLVKNLGIIEAETFVATLMRERFDYTKWRENLFEDMSVEELSHAAAEYSRTHQK